MRHLTLPDKVIEDPELRDRTWVFHDRRHAGQQTAELVRKLGLDHPLVLGIPSGGVPIGAEIARELEGELDVLVARKLQLPWNTEVGFGACTTEGPVILNPDLVESAGLTEEDISRMEDRTRKELRRRERVFRGNRPMPEIKGRNVILADDGLASGVTMYAAIGWAKERGPKTLVVAAPTGHLSTVAEMAEQVDYLICPNIRGGYSYAVAQAYKNWFDMGDEDVLAALEAFRPNAATA